MKKILLFSIPFLFLSCTGLTQLLVPSYSPIQVGVMVHEEYDDIENPFVTDGVVIYYDQIDEIELVKFTPAKHDVYYRISFSYAGSRWRFMDGVLKIEVDSVLHIFKDEEPYHSVLSGGAVREVVSVKLDEEFIKSLAYSSKLRIQAYLEPITFTEEQIGYIRDFYENYVSSE